MGRTKKLEELEGDTLVGEAGGHSQIIGECAPSSAIPGMWRVETEHGVLFLDPDFDVEVL